MSLKDVDDHGLTRETEGQITVPKSNSFVSSFRGRMGRALKPLVLAVAMSGFASQCAETQHTEGRKSEVCKDEKNLERWQESDKREKIDFFRIEAFDKLACAGINMGFRPHLLTSEKAENRAFIKALILLHEKGVRVDDDLIDTLTIEKAQSEIYIKAIYLLHKNGANIDYYLKSHLTDQQVQSTIYLKALILLHENGIEDAISLLDSLPPEKIKSEIYLRALVFLHKKGIELTRDLINFLTIEKAQNQALLNALTFFHENGIEDAISFVDLLSPEKIQSKVYLKALALLHEKGIGIYQNLIEDLTPEKAQRGAYLTILIANKGDFGQADTAYLRMSISGYREEAIVGRYSEHQGSTVLQNTNKLKKQNILNPVSMQIIGATETRYALQVIREINNMRGKTDTERQKVIKDLSLGTYFTLALHGREEFVDSSFNNVLFPLIMQKMNNDDEKDPAAVGTIKTDVMEWIEKNDPEFKNFRLVMAVFAKFEKLDVLLGTIRDANKLNTFMKKFIFGLDSNDPKALDDAIAITEALEFLQNKNITKSERYLKAARYSAQLEGYLKIAHSEAKGNNQLLYGLIASLHNHKAHTNFSVNKSFFEEMNRKYPLESISGIEHRELAPHYPQIIQEVIFYDDPDGRTSYQHMMDYYRRDTAWGMESHAQGWVLMWRVRGNLKIFKYVKKPTAGEVGMKAMQEDMKRSNLIPVQVVHRGHSYHVEETLKYIPSQAKIVFLGSCGGFSNVGAVLEKAEKAHIITTKSTGAMLVNDPFLKMLDDQLIKGRGVDWNDLWKQGARQIHNRNFKGYVNPSLNVSAQFINAYNKYRTIP